MTALLSPAMGGSMQSQMEAKLASMNLKSPGLKSNLPSSPTARNFSGSAIGGSSFLSPESANNAGDAAATLAQQRAKLKASDQAQARREALFDGVVLALHIAKDAAAAFPPLQSAVCGVVVDILQVRRPS